MYYLASFVEKTARTRMLSSRMRTAGFSCLLKEGCLPRGSLPRVVSASRDVCLGGVCLGRCLSDKVSVQEVSFQVGVHHPL